MGRRRGGGDQSVENSQFMGWTTGLESTQKLGEKGIDLTRVKGQTAVSKEVVDNMFRFLVRYPNSRLVRIGCTELGASTRVLNNHLNK